MGFAQTGLTPVPSVLLELTLNEKTTAQPHRDKTSILTLSLSLHPAPYVPVLTRARPPPHPFLNPTHLASGINYG